MAIMTAFFLLPSVDMQTCNYLLALLAGTTNNGGICGHCDVVWAMMQPPLGSLKRDHTENLLLKVYIIVLLEAKIIK